MGQNQPAVNIFEMIVTDVDVNVNVHKLLLREKA
jgi:hypothetical protein